MCRKHCKSQVAARVASRYKTTILPTPIGLEQPALVAIVVDHRETSLRLLGGLTGLGVGHASLSPNLLRT